MPPPRAALLLLVLALLGGVPPSAAVEEVPVGTWPLRPQPTVVHRFAPPPTPYSAGHRGVDLAASAGQAVRAALPGTIRFAGSIAGRGVVVVDHGATRTTYEPVTSDVSVGRTVSAGDRVGVVQPGPASHCFPQACLHWGWIEGETYLDPLLLVGAGPVRLLPLVPAGGAPARVLPGPTVPVVAGVRSGAGVGLLVGTAQAIGRDVGVALGGRQ